MNFALYKHQAASITLHMHKKIRLIASPPSACAFAKAADQVLVKKDLRAKLHFQWALEIDRLHTFASSHCSHLFLCTNGTYKPT